MPASYLFLCNSVFQPVYTYNPNSNLLRRVTDAGSGAPASANAPGFIDGAAGLKDFKDGTNGGDDYTYDANGNITGDLNKQYTATYNLLDKPERIIVQNNSMRDIRYVYDATGERLQKIVRHNDTVRTTTYIDGLTYHNDTTLLYFVNDAGRTRRNHRGRLVNDYYIDDHLGNVRMVLTDERDTTAYLAAFESNRDVVELATWRNRNTTRETIINTNLFFNNPNPNAQYSRLNGSDAARRQGPSLVLKVMAGDTFNVHTRALYNTPHSSVPNTSPLVNDMVNAAISAFLGVATGTLDNKSWLQTGSNNVLNTQDLASFVTSNQAANNSPNTGPRAYLKFLLFDENFKLVQGVAEWIDNGPDAVHTYTLPQIVAPKNGFLYIYSSNESPVNVFFDDITVVHRTGPLLQESAFYPFGMEITPLSSYAAIKTPNQKDYQRNELDEEFGVDLHYFDARMYDAQVGRFMGVDPVMESYLKTNGFHYNFNNPLSFVDQDGREPISLAIAFKIGLKALFKFGKKVVSKFVLPTKKMAVSSKVAWYAGASANIYQNRQHIGNGTLAGGLLKAVGFGIAGGTGASISMGKGALWSLGGMASGGMMTAGWAGITNDNDASFWQSFSRGASSAIFGKSFGKSAASGAAANSSVAANPVADGAGGLWNKTLKAAGKIGQTSTEKGLQSLFSKYGQYGEDGMKKYGGNFYWNAFWTGAAAGTFNSVVDLGTKFISKNIISSGWKGIFQGGSIALNSYYTDGIKFSMMYNNSEKKYRQFLSENKGMNRIWSISNAISSMSLFFEGYGY